MFDTNVLVAAMRSRNGASFALISEIPSDQFQPCVSVSLYAEWQEVLSRPENMPPGMGFADVDGFLRYLAGQCHLQEVYFHWRPYLEDADDDMVLELAFAAGCAHIITHNVSDYRGAERLSIQVVSPRDFLHQLRSEQ